MTWTMFFTPAPESHQKREKAKARELRQSQWWRQQIGQGRCHHCKEQFKPEELTMEHLIPIVRGGQTNKRNVVPSCKSCNSKKGYRMPIDEAFQELEDKKI